MKNYIIGISGHKGSGKDTVASMINYIFAIGISKANYAEWITKQISYNNTYSDRIIHFADSVKDCLSIIYNIPRTMFDDRKYKDEYWYCIDTGQFVEDKFVNKENSTYETITIDMLQNDYLNDIINSFTKFSCIKLRTLMQYFGTNICRYKLANDIWVKSAIGKIIDKANSRHLCIVPDIRYKNEADAVRNNTDFLYGGVIIIKRKSCYNTEHSSEIIDFSGDFEIENDGTLFQLFYKVLEICQRIK